MKLYECNSTTFVDDDGSKQLPFYKMRIMIYSSNTHVQQAISQTTIHFRNINSRFY